MPALMQARVLHEPPPVPTRRRGGRSAAVLLTLLAISLVVSSTARVLRADDQPSGESASPSGLSAQPVAAAAREPRDAEGATAAAIRYLSAYGSPAMYDRASRARTIAEFTAPARRAALQNDVDRAFVLAGRSLGLDAQGRSREGVLVARTVPVGTQVVSFTPERAVVSVWVMGLLGVAGAGSRYPVQETWSTETVTLEWGAERWRWLALEHADGPAPIGSAQVPADAQSISRAAQQYAEVVDAQ